MSTTAPGSDTPPQWPVWPQAWVLVASRRGEVKVRAKVTDRSRLGSIFMTFHHQATMANDITSSHRDPITGTPEYKSCAVRIEHWA